MRLFLTLLFVNLSVFNVFSQKEKVQAAFLLQFTKYIQWCSELSGGNFVIGVLGDSPVFSELNTIAQTKKLGNQSVVVKKLASASDINKCSVIFISESKSGQLDAVIVRVGNDCTLIVAEKEGMAKSGAGINFIETGGKLGFEINKTSIVSHALIINSSLVNLAKTVY